MNWNHTDYYRQCQFGSPWDNSDTYAVNMDHTDTNDVNLDLTDTELLNLYHSAYIML